MEMEHDELSLLLEEFRNKIENSPHDDVISLDISTAKKILKYLEESEEDIEDTELSARFGSRADLPDDQWITLPPNQSLKEWYEERRRERLKGK
ncbi:hypothetical protein bcgnr5378_08120 [Bacillus cereus]